MAFDKRTVPQKKGGRGRVREGKHVEVFVSEITSVFVLRHASLLITPFVLALARLHFVHCNVEYKRRARGSNGGERGGEAERGGRNKTTERRAGRRRAADTRAYFNRS